LPPNTLPMMTGTGPFGLIEMGGMFTTVKIREGLAKDDYRDPGWYKHPPGTVASEVDAGAAGDAERQGDAQGHADVQDPANMRGQRDSRGQGDTQGQGDDRECGTPSSDDAPRTPVR